MNYRIALLLYLQISSIWTAPLKIIQAQPQIMMHTLQQPSPMETLQSIKAQKLNQDFQESSNQMMINNLKQQMAMNTLQELAKIQAMQYAAGQIEVHPPELMQTWLPQIPAQSVHPMNMPWQPLQSSEQQNMQWQQQSSEQQNMSWQPQSSEQQNIPWHQQTPINQQQSVMPMIQQMSEEAMQEIALQQQMLALQQMQAFNQLNAAHSPYTFPQLEPVLILLPDEKNENPDLKLYKNTNAYGTKTDDRTDQEHDNEYLDSVVVDSSIGNETEPEAPKGTRKAILLIPNARISIGGIVSQIPWLPIEVNVPDTAIWAWNGIYNGISSIISIIGSRLPWRQKPQGAGAAATEPSVKAFLKQLQQNDYGNTIPVYPMSLDTVIPVNFN